jgi:hypothetical protein
MTKTRRGLRLKQVAARSRGASSADVVTVVRLMPLGPAGQGTDQSGIVANFERACLRTEGDAIFLVIRNESSLVRLEVGDIVHWVAEPFGVVWRAERAAEGTAPGFPEAPERDSNLRPSALTTESSRAAADRLRVDVRRPSARKRSADGVPSPGSRRTAGDSGSASSMT